MRFLIHGFYGAGNAGDDAILHAIMERIVSVCAQAEMTVCVRSQTIPPYYGRHPVRTVSGFDLNQLHHAVDRSDIVIVGGGGLFQDYSGFTALQLFQGTRSALSRQGAINYYSAPVFLAKTLGKPILFYGLGIGPFHTEEARRATGWISGLADAVTVRDRGSYTILKELGVDGVLLAADPAVGLEAQGGTPLPGRPLVESAGLSSAAAPRIGLNLRRWPFGSEDGLRAQRALLHAARKLVKDRGARLYIFPFNVSRQEELLAEGFADQLPEGSAEVVPYTGRSPLEMKALLGSMDLVIAMRLHALILAMSAGTPAIGLSYDPKVAQFYAEVGLSGLCVELGRVEPAMLSELAEAVLGERDSWSARVEAHMAPLRERERINGDVLEAQLAFIREGRGRW